MNYIVDSGIFIKTLNALISFLDAKDELTITRVSSGLVIYRESTSVTSAFFRIPVVGGDEPNLTKYTVSIKDIKPISSLSASVVDSYTNLTFTNNVLVIDSNVKFEIPCKAETVQVESGWGVGDLIYLETDTIKILSKFLNKLSKDNFKGSFMSSREGFVLPGLYHISCVPAPLQADTQPYSLKSVQLNKLLKLGQDLTILPQGRIASDEEITYLINLPKAPKEASLANKKHELDSIFTEDLPFLTILEPKTFKTFLKNTKSDDKQYDLCSLRTEESRIVINFFRDKQPSNSFVYSNVETPNSFVNIYLQTKHLLALSELATDKIQISFSSNFEPIKVVIDEVYTMYLMQGVVA